MEIYEKFSTEENSKQPIVILHPFNVIADDVKKLIVIYEIELVEISEKKKY